MNRADLGGPARFFLVRNRGFGMRMGWDSVDWGRQVYAAASGDAIGFDAERVGCRATRIADHGLAGEDRGHALLFRPAAPAGSQEAGPRVEPGATMGWALGRRGFGMIGRAMRRQRRTIVSYA